MVYVGILAHGMVLPAAECARIIPHLSASSIRQAMHWATDERRLSDACAAVLQSMHRHPIAVMWGATISSLLRYEAWKPASGSVGHGSSRAGQTPPVWDLHALCGIAGASFQLIMLNERQVGAAIEGVVRHEALETAQLAVDTHGYTDFAMTLARMLGFDLCPRLKNLKERRLHVARGTPIPGVIRPIRIATADPQLIEAQWDRLVHLAASVRSGHAGAVASLASVRPAVATRATKPEFNWPAPANGLSHRLLRQRLLPTRTATGAQPW